MRQERKRIQGKNKKIKCKRERQKESIKQNDKKSPKSECLNEERVNIVRKGKAEMINDNRRRIGEGRIGKRKIGAEEENRRGRNKEKENRRGRNRED